MPLTAIALNCSLKSRADESSSTDRMIGVIAGALARHDVTLSETIRMVDHDVKAGVTSDEGEGDAWPDLRRRILEADILIFGTPVWLGQMSSYWVGEAMGKIDFKDLGEVPDKVRQTADMLASNAAHLARLLKERPYPGVG